MASYSFLFLFLPLSLYGFFSFARAFGQAPALAYLLLCSFCFYGFSMGAWLSVLLCSISFNYTVGAILQKKPMKPLLTLGIFINVAVLAFFKYGALLFSQEGLIFPLALSFFTFQQIAYLVDSYKKIFPQRPALLPYALGVSFFPLLTAGPITRHAKLIPQWLSPGTFCFSPQNCSLGLSLFVLGLFKKVVLADGCFGPTADVLFGALKENIHLSLVDAWLATLSYTFQIYFDFSGYSEMALGLGYCFNLELPLNFNSPYKSTSIIEFWRSWHMSLSSFLKDYIYIPLGGNRYGAIREYLNIFIVMLLGGIWHGATLNFVAWGAVHGLYVTLNHLWRRVQRVYKIQWTDSYFWKAPMCGLTFLAVALAWVIFRADSLASAGVLFKGLIGMNGIALPPKLGQLPYIKVLFPSALFSKMGLILQDPLSVLFFLGKGFLIIGLLPSLPDFFGLSPKPGRPCLQLAWKSHWTWALGLALVWVYTLFSLQGYRGQFVYYQF